MEDYKSDTEDSEIEESEAERIKADFDEFMDKVTTYN